MTSSNKYDLIKPDNWVLNSFLFISSCAFFVYIGQGENVWYDEGVTLFYTNKSLKELFEFSMVDNNPPLYNLLLFLWSKVFGYGIWTSRFLSVLFMSTSLVVLYKIGRLLYGSFNAFLSVIFFALINIIKYHAIEIRAYGLMLMLSLFCIYLMVKLYKTNRVKYFHGWIVVMWCLFFTHYASVIFLMVSSLMILPYIIKWDSIKTQAWKTVGLLLITLGTIAFWIQYPLKNSQNMGGSDFWLKSPDWDGLKYTLSELSLVLGVNYRIYFALIVGCSLVAVFRRNKSAKYISVAMLVALVLLPAISYAISQTIPMFGVRYLIYLVPIILIAFFHVMSNLPVILGKIVVFGLLLQVVINPSKEMHRPDYKELVQYVNNHNEGKSLVVLNGNWMVYPYLINQYGNVFRTDKSVTDKCREDNLLPTSTKDFESGVDLKFLRAYDNIAYVTCFGGQPDPDGLITRKLQDDFILTKTNNEIYDFRSEYFTRKKNVEQLELVNLNLSNEEKMEVHKVVQWPFDVESDLEFVSFTEGKNFGLKAMIDLTDNFGLNKLSELKIKITLNVKKMGLDCFLVAEILDKKGNILLYETEKLSDLDIEFDQWKTYEMHLPIGDHNGRSIKCYVWNSGGYVFDVKPMEFILENLIHHTH